MQIKTNAIIFMLSNSHIYLKTKQNEKDISSMYSPDNDVGLQRRRKEYRE